MNWKSKVAALPIPPGEYKREDFNQISRKLNEILQCIYNQGDIVGCSLLFVTANGRITLAETGYGLANGGVYVDKDGYLKMVRETDVFAPSFMARVKLGTVTVTT